MDHALSNYSGRDRLSKGPVVGATWQLEGKREKASVDGTESEKVEMWAGAVLGL